MIDYLTPLLEGTPAADWRGPVRPVGTAPVRQADGEEAAPNAAAPREVGDLETARRAGAEELAPSDPVRDQDILWSEPPGRRTTGAAALEAQLRRSGRLSQAAQTGGAAVTVALPEGAQPAASAADLTALDRAVRRDARRYDSGFTLY